MNRQNSITGSHHGLRSINDTGDVWMSDDHAVIPRDCWSKDNLQI